MPILFTRFACWWSSCGRKSTILLPLPVASLTSSMSEGWTFPPVFRLKMDMVDLRQGRLVFKYLDTSLVLTAVYDTVPLWMWMFHPPTLIILLLRERKIIRKQNFYSWSFLYSGRNMSPIKGDPQPLAWKRAACPLRMDWEAKGWEAPRRVHTESTWGGHRALAHTLSWLTVFGRHR